MIGNDWDIVLKDCIDSDKFKELMDKVDSEYKSKEIYPLREDLFNAYKMTSYNDTKVVIIGQDPYHGEGEAHGLSFSVRPGNAIPPSLRHIYKELESDVGCYEPLFGDLTDWANEGVLMLNNTLTVVKDTPNSHSKLGWNYFTDETIRKLNEKDTPVVFILWGSFAQTKKSLITNPKHLIIESSHPSPFSARRGFFGSKPFSKTNEFLIQNNLKPIDWQIKS